MMERYYEQLDESKKEIRLLRIRPTEYPEDVDALLACSLKRVPLAAAGPFYALSYVWGDTVQTAPITLDGNQLCIRKNLYDFLYCLRKLFCETNKQGDGQSAELWVWADYICINQADLTERSAQVTMMGEIYQSANAVYAWIGDSGDLQMRSLDMAGLSVANDTSRTRARSSSWKSLGSSSLAIAEILRAMNRTQYWERLWIKQEVILAKDIWFFCSSAACNWRDIRPEANLNRQRYESPRRTSLVTGSKNNTLSSRSESPSQAAAPLLNLRTSSSSIFHLPRLIRKFRDAECRDPRDRIYALLSLVDAETRAKISVDYKKPLLQVLLETYQYWSEERTKMFRGATGDDLPTLHEAHTFCAQMSMLLTDADFALLHSSQQLREAVTSKGFFMTSGLSEIASVCQIAHMNTDDVKPKLAEPGESWGRVLRVCKRPGASRQADRRHEFFIYTECNLAAGDFLAHVGPCLLFIRTSDSSTRNDSLGDDSGPKVIGTGTNIVSRSQLSIDYGQRLCTQTVQHPCEWVRQRLQDAEFHFVNSSGKDKGLGRGIEPHMHGIPIMCNAAAILTMLIESGTYQLAAMKQPSDVSDHTPTEWRPYAFGVYHKILESCSVCSGMSGGLFQEADWRDCECKWIDQVC